MQIINSDDLINNENYDFFQTTSLENLNGTKKIIEDVKLKGDESIIEYSREFGDGNFSSAQDFIVKENEIEDAFSKTPDSVIKTMQECIKNVKIFAQKQLECIKNLKYEVGDSTLGHTIIPMKRVLCYVPGGNYPLPSSAIMTCTPAKVAGVEEIMLTSPKIMPQTIVAAKLSGADKIYKIGGAQAISAFAYGTPTIEPVDKIVGPGNKYVTYAKKYVYGQCSIDFLAGPSEVLIIADDNQNPELVSADILAQCEHDKDARGYLICFSEDFAKRVITSAKAQLETLETKEMARAAFDKSLAVIVKDMDSAIALSDKRAPEHLELMFKGAQELSDRFTNYGSLFIGKYCAEVFGDYCSGTNHVLPTNRAARYSGGLSVFDFIKIQTYQNISHNYAKELSKLASEIANQEGLMAHKLASDLRGQNEI